MDNGWLDWTLWAVLAFSVVLGALRGLVREVISLAAWVYLPSAAIPPITAAASKPNGPPSSSKPAAAALAAVVNESTLSLNAAAPFLPWYIDDAA